MNATVVPNTSKTPRSIMLYKMLSAPLDLGGGGETPGLEGVVDGVVEPPDGVVEPPDGEVGVVGVLGVLLAATTVIANFMPSPQ